MRHLTRRERAWLTALCPHAGLRHDRYAEDQPAAGAVPAHVEGHAATGRDIEWMRTRGGAR